MNIKQFINSSLFRSVDFVSDIHPGSSSTIRFLTRAFFVNLGYERVRLFDNTPQLFFSLYLFGFFLSFVSQILALLIFGLGYDDTGALFFDNVLMPQDLVRLEFLEDYYNLANYIVIVPLYIASGCFFIISLGKTKQETGPFFSAETSSAAGFNSLLVLSFLVFIVVMILQSFYAYDVRDKSVHLFWFHGDNGIDGAYTRRGYAYLYLNFVLCGFVAVVGLLHFELFRMAIAISRIIKQRTYGEIPEDEAGLWESEDSIKEKFSMFTQTTVWSKIFAILLAINIYTWKKSGVNGAIQGDSIYFDLVFVFFVVCAFWLVSLPRYLVQYRIHILREKKFRRYDYKDIRMSWYLGVSVFIDFILIGFVTHAIVDHKLVEFFLNFYQHLFSASV